MRNTCRKKALGVLGALTEVLCSSWCSRFSCIRIWKSGKGPKELLYCTMNFLTSYLGMVRGAPALSHAHLSHPGFKGNLRHRDTESSGILVPGPGVDEVGTRWHSMVQLVNLMRKLSCLISGINTMDVYWCHRCIKLPYNHRRERSSTRARFISSKCRCQKQAEWTPVPKFLSVFLIVGSTWARGSDLTCTSYMFRSSEINHTVSWFNPSWQLSTTQPLTQSPPVGWGRESEE